jgi:hypothetical protein
MSPIPPLSGGKPTSGKPASTAAFNPYPTLGALGGAASALLMSIDCVPCALNLWHNPRHYGEQLNHRCGISRIPQMPNESVSSYEG